MATTTDPPDTTDPIDPTDGAPPGDGDADHDPERTLDGPAGSDPTAHYRVSPGSETVRPEGVQ